MTRAAFRRGGRIQLAPASYARPTHQANAPNQNTLGSHQHGCSAPSPFFVRMTCTSYPRCPRHAMALCCLRHDIFWTLPLTSGAHAARVACMQRHGCSRDRAGSCSACFGTGRSSHGQRSHGPSSKCLINKCRMHARRGLPVCACNSGSDDGGNCGGCGGGNDGGGDSSRTGCANQVCTVHAARASEAGCCITSAFLRALPRAAQPSVLR